MDWERYDMRESVMDSPMSDSDVKGMTQDLYRAFMTPQYVLRKLTSIRSPDDLRFMKKGVQAVAGHLRDFSH